MKSSFLVLAFLGAATSAQAQSAASTATTSGSSAGGGSIAAGTISLGGGIGYSNTTSQISYNVNGNPYSNDTKSSQFSFTPTVGYFIASNLELGLSLGYSSRSQSYTIVPVTPSPVTTRVELDPTTMLQVGPYVRYYKMLSDQFGVTGALNAGFQHSRDYDYNNSTITEFKGSGFYASMTLAIVFFPVPRFAMSASMGCLGYNRMSYAYPKA